MPNTISLAGCKWGSLNSEFSLNCYWQQSKPRRLRKYETTDVRVETKKEMWYFISVARSTLTWSPHDY